MKRLAFACIAVCIEVTAASAAEFWEIKPFLDWSDREAQRMLNDSPWTGLVAITLPNRGPVPTEDGGGGRGGGGRGGGEQGFGPGPVRVRITISWRSALPLKQAIVRQQVGQRGIVPPPAQTFLDTADEHYVIGLQGLPPQYSVPGRGREVVIAAFLKRDGNKPPIPVQQATPLMTKDGLIMLLRFPKTDPITLADEHVELEAKFGELQQIKKKFKLKDLIYAGSLAL
jgi:hypothetical protein